MGQSLTMGRRQLGLEHMNFFGLDILVFNVLLHRFLFNRSHRRHYADVKGKKRRSTRLGVEGVAWILKEMGI